MQQHTIIMDSWKTSNSTITLRDFHMIGIDDGYKYVPKAHEIEPPFLKVVQLPSRNMNLSIVTDKVLFADYHNLGRKGEDYQEKKQKIMSPRRPDSSSVIDDAFLNSISDCDSMECNPDLHSEEYYPEVKLYSPQEYFPEVQLISPQDQDHAVFQNFALEEYNSNGQTNNLEEYNPWQPGM